VHELGFWLEIVTLLIPGFNDSESELQDLTGFLADISPDIPWHVTAFHQDYHMTGPPNTTPAMLERAAAIGRQAGLHFVYAGNLPGRVGDLENTICPGCGRALITRFGYHVQSYRLTSNGGCPDCKLAIPGRWGAGFEGQITSRPFLPRRRISVVQID
jgi:pyruvate formate lyase activating enzyme